MTLDALTLTARVATRRRGRQVRGQIFSGLFILALLASAWIARPSAPRSPRPDLAQDKAIATEAHAFIDELEAESDHLVAWASSVAHLQDHLADLDAAALTVQEQATSSRARRDASRSLTLDTPLDFIY